MVYLKWIGEGGGVQKYWSCSEALCPLKWLEEVSE